MPRIVGSIGWVSRRAQRPLALVFSALLGSGLAAPVVAQDHRTPLCDGRTATIVGTSESERIVGTPRDDVIVAYGGDDQVRGRGGADVICALAGADWIWGGSGDDRIFAGVDRWSCSRSGCGRAGDSVDPGAGNDFVDLGTDRRSGGGTDVLRYDGVSHGIVADLSRGAGVVQAEGTDTVRVGWRLGVIGTRYADVITGGPKSDYVVGWAGDDVVNGRGGDDVIYTEKGSAGDVGGADVVVGGTGDDFIVSQSGPDDIAGGGGNDDIYVSFNPRASVLAGPGNDRIFGLFGGRPRWLVDGGSGVDELTLSVVPGDGPSRGALDLQTGLLTARAWPSPGTVLSTEAFGLPDDLAWRFVGTDADENLEGGWERQLQAWMGGGNDHVSGTRGSDDIDAGDGEDEIWGGPGTDICLNAEKVSECEVLQSSSGSHRTRQSGLSSYQTLRVVHQREAF